MSDDFTERRSLIEALVQTLAANAADGKHEPKDSRFLPLLPREVRRIASRWSTSALRSVLARDVAGECLVGDFGKRAGTPYTKRARGGALYVRGKPKRKTKVVPVRDLLFNFMLPRSLLEGERLTSKCGDSKCCNPWHHTLRV